MCLIKIINHIDDLDSLSLFLNILIVFKLEKESFVVLLQLQHTDRRCNNKLNHHTFSTLTIYIINL